MSAKNGTRGQLADAVLKAAVEFEMVYLPANMERTFAPNLSRTTDAEFEKIREIRQGLFDLRESLTSPRKK